MYEPTSRQASPSEALSYQSAEKSSAARYAEAFGMSPPPQASPPLNYQPSTQSDDDHNIDDMYLTPPPHHDHGMVSKPQHMQTKRPRETDSPSDDDLEVCSCTQSTRKFEAQMVYLVITLCRQDTTCKACGAGTASVSRSKCCPCRFTCRW